MYHGEDGSVCCHRGIFTLISVTTAELWWFLIHYKHQPGMRWNNNQFQSIHVSLICIDPLRPRQNGRRSRHFKAHFLEWKSRISIKISLKFAPKGPINNILALVQIMAWRWPGYKPLSEPMMVSLLTHICITLPQWVKYNTPVEVYGLCVTLHWTFLTQTFFSFRIHIHSSFLTLWEINPLKTFLDAKNMCYDWHSEI